jgi:transcriptional regulator with XRE-family HTH domain
VSWRKIKAEYIAGGISQRALAEKYGVPFGTLSKRARKESWNAKRRKADEKAAEKVAQKTAEKTAEIVADNATLAEQIKTTLLRKLAILAEQVPTDATETKLKKTDGTEITFRMRDLAAVYESLSDKMARGMSADIEDLSPLSELLRE